MYFLGCFTYIYSIKNYILTSKYITSFILIGINLPIFYLSYKLFLNFYLNNYGYLKGKWPLFMEKYLISKEKIAKNEDLYSVYQKLYLINLSVYIFVSFIVYYFNLLS